MVGCIFSPLLPKIETQQLKQLLDHDLPDLQLMEMPATFLIIILLDSNLNNCCVIFGWCCSS